MAAPAGGGGSAVSVLAPNGRRHTVKVTPSTVLLQVLEDTCRRQDFNPNEYDLKFQRNVLDLSLQWRFANLPNNAKLEMVPISRSREGPETMVRVALQLDDGSRLQDAFCSGRTLWELLCHFAQIRERLERPCQASPVCVYMRDEVTGRAALQSTTLQSLGLTGGSATIRFAMKPWDAASTQEPGAAQSRSPGSPRLTPAGQAAGSPLLPLNPAGLSHGDVSRQDAAASAGPGLTDGPGPTPADAQAKPVAKEPAPAPFVPFSGGGQRLGGPCGAARPLVSPSAKPPKSFSSPAGPSKPKKSRPGQEPQQEPEPELEPPVDRAPVVCHPDLEVLLQAWPAELPDEFFEVTVDDVRRRLAQLKSERKRLEEAPLVTKALREAQMKEKLQRYPKVVLRVLFPDRHILQGFFRPSETVGDLRDFVRSHLGNPALPFHLFIAPPKTILDDHTLTLFQVPACQAGGAAGPARSGTGPGPGRGGWPGGSRAPPKLVGALQPRPCQDCPWSGGEGLVAGLWGAPEGSRVRGRSHGWPAAWEGLGVPAAGSRFGPGLEGLRPGLSPRPRGLCWECRAGPSPLAGARSSQGGEW
uniref:Tether containing UBX domain for GLUT4 n=1 Tax=Sus scrofa TaxID=9823 RepID=A0A8D1NYG4_PIG